MKKLLIIFSLLFGWVNAIFAQNNEAFDPSLHRLSTLESLNNYIDSLMLANNIPCDSREEVMLVNKVIENRFYHRYCHYAPEENLLAYLAGKYAWDHLSAIVISEDILKYDYAACSQQAIVMMRILKSRGFRVRKLGLVGHFVLEVFYDKAWHFYDPNKEPLIQGIPHDSLAGLVKNGTMARAYANNGSPDEVYKMFSKMEVGATNEYPAKNARLFHNVTKFLSDYFFAIVFIIGSLAFTAIKFFLNKPRAKRNNKSKMNQKVLV